MTVQAHSNQPLVCGGDPLKHKGKVITQGEESRCASRRQSKQKCGRALWNKHHRVIIYSLVTLNKNFDLASPRSRTPIYEINSNMPAFRTANNFAKKCLIEMLIYNLKTFLKTFHTCRHTRSTYTFLTETHIYIYKNHFYTCMCGIMFDRNVNILHVSENA